MAEWDIPFNEANWEAFTQMNDPSQPLSEQEFRKLYKDKLNAASFQFNPSAWEEMEAQLGPEGGMSDEEMRQLFEKKVNESAFAFNSENWSRMEHLLDEQARRPLAYYWRSVAAILLLALSTSLLWWPSLSVQKNDVSSPTNMDGIQPQASEINSNSELPQEPGSVPPTTPLERSIPINGDVASGGGEVPPSSVAAQTSMYQQGPSLTDQLKQLNTNAVAHVSSSYLPLVALASIQAPKFEVRAFLEDLPKKAFTNQKPEYVPVTYSSLYAVGGPNLSPGFNGQMGSAFSAGLVYEYGLNEFSSFELGVVYNQAAVGIETLSDSTFFGLSSTNINTHRHYKNVASLRIPVSYRLKLDGRHSFNLGLYADAMLQVKMDEKVTTTIFKQEPRIESRAYNQPMNSFESFNFGANFGYSYQYSDRLSLGLSYNLGLSDITKDHASGFESDHRPEQLSIDLRYRLFKR